eukprot:maker-scaffold_2-snap-gene-8.36-mRNA-1 protein AED:0.01 eAED:0.01 QI:60/1/0.75/1/1/1/4/0/693
MQIFLLIRKFVDTLENKIKLLPTDKTDFLSLFEGNYESNKRVALLLPFVSAVCVLLCWIWVVATHTERKKVSYEIPRILILRSMCLVYSFAFYTNLVQASGLYGENGLYPVYESFQEFQQLKFVKNEGRPTPIFHVLNYLSGTFANTSSYLNSFDDYLFVTGAAGLVLSMVCFCAKSSSFLFRFSGTYILLWTCYLTIINSGSQFLIGYGWEWLTLEVGFLCVFLADFVPRKENTQTIKTEWIMYLFKWVLFRVLLGAGLSKIGSNSSRCWLELTCTTTHYFTQPMPTIFSWPMHFLPRWFHKTEVLLTSVEQLALPFFIFSPFRTAVYMAAVLEVSFQLVLIFTGNYAHINYITLVPALALFDDSFFRRWGITYTLNKKSSNLLNIIVARFENLLILALYCLVAWKSVDPVLEMFSSSPWLHYYDDFFLVNAQGVFGFINEHRLVFEIEYLNFVPSELRDVSTQFEEFQDSCRDAPGKIAIVNEQSYGCNELYYYCPSNAQLRQMCRKTCGDCSFLELSTSNERKIMGLNRIWEKLSFYNLPSSETSWPRFSSPYHNRLSWEIWIRSTASMEHVVTNFLLKKQQQSVPLPDIVTRVAKRLVTNCDRAFLDLLETGTNCSSARVVRITPYQYTMNNASLDSPWTKVKVGYAKLLFDLSEQVEASVQKSLFSYKDTVYVGVISCCFFRILHMFC